MWAHPLAVETFALAGVGQPDIRSSAEAAATAGMLWVHPLAVGTTALMLWVRLLAFEAFALAGALAAKSAAAAVASAAAAAVAAAPVAFAAAAPLTWQAEGSATVILWRCAAPIYLH